MDLLFHVIQWLVKEGEKMPLFADFSRPETIAVLIPLGAMMGGIIIAIIAVIAAGRKKELEHKERLLAMEKGIEIPQPSVPECRPAYQSNRTAGFVMTLLGIALTIAIWAVAGSRGGVWGLIPLAIGIGLLISAAVEKKEWEKKESRVPGGER
jgi:hypothetical protein